ncbi:hypothetical protein OC25_26290 [Pedobacter kyungheensis]|uniref:Uncharacterized protein n=2 Tax=Pedobacter kyungheensis TaxID=1069985 RepID=A0A0C1CVC5_9SPHI|nr:hypothetical protein OC25_26290 [Pedobacter kyungheensis]
MPLKKMSLKINVMDMEFELNVETIVRQHDLTIEEVLSKQMFSHFTEEQAKDVVLTIKKMSIIIFNASEKKEEKI